MAKVVADITMSMDGFVAGPKPTVKDPLGQGGMRLHEWAFKLKEWRGPHGLEHGETGQDNDVIKESQDNQGAVIMGRKMYSGGKGPWQKDPIADGWWGNNPPFHLPVFVLTHHPRDTVIKEGGTSFIFVTDGIESALKQAKKAAGGKNVAVAGGASVIQQLIKDGLLDELQIHIVPILLGGGTPLLANLGNTKLEKIRVIDSPLVTHLKFRIKN